MLMAVEEEKPFLFDVDKSVKIGTVVR